MNNIFEEPKVEVIIFSTEILTTPSGGNSREEAELEDIDD